MMNMIMAVLTAVVTRMSFSRQAELPVDEETHGESVDHRDYGSLGGCKDPSVDAPEDDDGHEEGKDRILEGGPYGRSARLLRPPCTPSSGR
ncbi:hypothetical protein MASR1M66_04310 [Aminivibrio sp.]